MAAVIPGAKELIDAAPAPAGMSKLLGGLAGALGGSSMGNFAALAGGFKQLNLDPNLIGKFVPDVLSFVQGKGGADVAQLLNRALSFE